MKQNENLEKKQSMADKNSKNVEEIIIVTEQRKKILNKLRQVL